MLIQFCIQAFDTEFLTVAKILDFKIAHDINELHLGVRLYCKINVHISGQKLLYKISSKEEQKEKDKKNYLLGKE